MVAGRALFGQHGENGAVVVRVYARNWVVVVVVGEGGAGPTSFSDASNTDELVQSWDGSVDAVLFFARVVRWKVREEK